MEEHISKFLEYLEITRGYSIHTVRNYKKDLEIFKIFLKKEGIDNIEEVDYQILRNYLSYLHPNYNKKSIGRFLSTIRMFFKYLTDNKVITNNPTILISNPKLDKKLPIFLHENELDKMFDVPDKNTYLGNRNYTILNVLYSTGIRVSELVNIKLNDINYDDMTIKVLGKGNRERYVLFGLATKEIINNHINLFRSNIVTNSDYLFLNKNADQLTERGVRLIINNILKRTTINKKISPHTLRHTFATHLLQSGADLKVVQELLGHVNLSTTEVYTHITSEKLRNTYLDNHPRARRGE